MNSVGIAAGAMVATTAATIAMDVLARRALRCYEDLDVEAASVPGQRFWLRGVAIHYVEAGAGYPVVLVHGFGGSTFSFRHTIPALARKFRVIAVDLPGFGYSDRSPSAEYSQTRWVELLHEFLQRLGVPQAAFIGHSLGGGVVQRFAVAHPEVVAQLVLVRSVSAARPTRGLPRLLGPALRVVQPAVLTRPRLMARLAQRMAFDPDFVTAEVIEGYVRPTRLPGSAAAVHKLFLSARHDRPVDLGPISAPTLILYGDRVVGPARTRRLHRAIAGSQLETIPRAGHLPLEEQPELCNRLLVEFFAGLRPRPETTSTNGPGLASTTAHSQG